MKLLKLTLLNLMIFPSFIFTAHHGGNKGEEIILVRTEAGSFKVSVNANTTVAQIKQILIPQIEKKLGRKVAIEALDWHDKSDHSIGIFADDANKPFLKSIVVFPTKEEYIIAISKKQKTNASGGPLSPEDVIEGPKKDDKQKAEKTSKTN